MKTKMLGILLVLSVVFLISCTATIEEQPTPNEPLNNNTISLEGEYIIDTEKSSLGWYSERIVGNNHKGTVPIKSGSFNFDEQTGEFFIDMTQITEERDNEMFLNHLKSDDFFNVEVYPESKFALTGITAQGNQHIVKGDLLIKDISNEIYFNTVFTEENNYLVARASFSIDRTLWNITYDSGNFFQQLGDRAIRDNIEYDLELYFTK